MHILENVLCAVIVSVTCPHKYRSTSVCDGGGFTQQRCLSVKHHKHTQKQTHTDTQTETHTASGEKLVKWLNCSCQEGGNKIREGEEEEEEEEEE